ADSDLISVDQVDWKPFTAWPELVHAMTASPSDAAGSERDDWLAERNSARARWADQRTGEDRRAAEPGAGGNAANRRDNVSERRTSDPTAHGRGPLRSQGRLPGNLPVWALVVALLVAGGLIALLVSLFGAVNPVEVRLR